MISREVVNNCPSGNIIYKIKSRESSTCYRMNNGLEIVIIASKEMMAILPGKLPNSIFTGYGPSFLPYW
jgi:hypothetical protein